MRHTQCECMYISVLQSILHQSHNYFPSGTFEQMKENTSARNRQATSESNFVSRFYFFAIFQSVKFRGAYNRIELLITAICCKSMQMNKTQTNTFSLYIFSRALLFDMQATFFFSNHLPIEVCIIFNPNQPKALDSWVKLFPLNVRWKQTEILTFHIKQQHKAMARTKIDNVVVQLELIASWNFVLKNATKKGFYTNGKANSIFYRYIGSEYV